MPTGIYKRPDAIERFLRMVGEPDSDGCWPWLGGRQTSGYGVFYFECRYLRAHRWSYEYFIGPISEDLTIDHLCGHPWCVNPEHMNPCGLAENIRRSQIKEVCIRGHNLTPDNTSIIRQRGNQTTKRCKTCHRIRQAAYNQRKKEANNG